MLSGYLQTAELIGNITMYEGEIARSILIKKSRVLEQLRKYLRAAAPSRRKRRRVVVALTGSDLIADALRAPLPRPATYYSCVKLWKKKEF